MTYIRATDNVAYGQVELEAQPVQNVVEHEQLHKMAAGEGGDCKTIGTRQPQGMEEEDITTSKRIIKVY